MRSTSIRPRQTREMKRAARHAYHAGRPLTRYVVINFPTPLEGDELAPQRAFKSIRTKCRSWWDHKRRTNGDLGPLTDLRSWENKNGIIHVNWLIRIPDDLHEEFAAKRTRWIAKAVKDHPDEAVKDIEIYNLNGVLNYVLKGTDPAKAQAFGIRPVFQGEVWGRRAAASMNLGKAARARDIEAGIVTKPVSRPPPTVIYDQHPEI